MTENKILEEREKKELKKWVPIVIEKFRKKGVSNIVTFDRSGRAVGSLVRETWKKLYPNEDAPKLFFINPSILQEEENERKRRSTSRKEADRIIKEIVDNKILKKESPYLYEEIKKNPSSIGIVDEFMYKGETIDRVKRLFKEINEEANPPVEVFQKWKEGGFLPSWYEKANILSGVTDEISNKKDAKKLISEKANLSKEEREQFLRFRKELEKLSYEIANKKREKAVNKKGLFKRISDFKKRFKRR